MITANVITLPFSASHLLSHNRGLLDFQKMCKEQVGKVFFLIFQYKNWYTIVVTSPGVVKLKQSIWRQSADQVSHQMIAITQNLWYWCIILWILGYSHHTDERIASKFVVLRRLDIWWCLFQCILIQDMGVFYHISST